MIKSLVKSQNDLQPLKLYRGQIWSSRYGNYRSSKILLTHRYQSSSTKQSDEENTKVIDNESIYVVSIPITTYKSYIFCNHKPSILHTSQLKKIPLITKVEDKLTSVASKGWNKLNNSKVDVNIKVSKFIKKLLNTIPYEENCLRSFPSKNSMIREINEEALNINKLPTSNLIQSEITNLKIPSDQLKPIPLLHPSFQNPCTILNQLYSFRDESFSKHLKYASLCAIGIPITLPFALIPVLPNVPGFYLAYRLYCNVKALLGVKHLDYLLQDCTSSSASLKLRKNVIADQKSVTDTKHLAFRPIQVLDQIYTSDNSHLELVDSVQDEERIIITEDIINRICNQLELSHLREDLLKALTQERVRLGKSLKIDDAVQ